MENISDENIMEGVKQGNIDLLTFLYKRYCNQILNYFFRMTGNIDDSRDLTQSLFIRIIRYKKSFKQNMIFKYWIFKIARNMFYTEYKRRQKHNESLNYIDNNICNESNYNPDEDKLLFSAIYKLPDEYKELIIISKFSGFKNNEIAKMYNISDAALKNKLYRALNKLREIYFKTELTE